VEKEDIPGLEIRSRPRERYDVGIDTDTARPGSAPRDFTGSATRRTYVWPGASLCEESLQESLGTVMKQFRESGVWR